jgi:hypothetical protein
MGIIRSPESVFPFLYLVLALYFGYHLQQALFYNETFIPFAGLVTNLMFSLALFFGSAAIIDVFLSRRAQV